ncbi:fungal zn(2)-Cys(6) binuclear cluster domain-containing protein [Trichoderma breve]|uniref:Fungal zn(2)-Cys(6) binuclear cluster domain-containing protein n=1 Tax=Trichoderma breve TaxID=2034170 RepID=A0A9W9B8K2_9HYPO|nr:fungal zn(2)-Cys(6) binuclear cluster domain-containing protein [Trichoderma breve]KAJ4857954.1 fungal zn(2)-Cys(6) binuclear cluster domain-containing protein [Trichoderma breve]
MRSYSGCVTCRHRKLKCDEERPVCQNCTKSSRDCRYVERAVFRSFDSSVLLNGKLKNSVDTREPFDDNQTWLSIPRRRLVTFINIEDPYDYDSPSLPECDLENLDHSVAHNLDDETTQTPHTGKDETSDRDGDNLTHFSRTLNGDEPLAIPRSNDDSHDNILTLRLLRHFKEGPGQWMDTFDTGAYFSHKVTVMAATKPLLKSAVCALAAKHLGHCQTNMTRRYGELSDERRILLSPFDDRVDWHYQSAKHYGYAIKHLKIAINLGAFETDDADKEELFASITILCTYELMDAPGTAWSAHLSALPLFSPRPDAELILGSPISIPRAPVSGPIFWSLARQDLLCSFISETQTRLDLKDIRLWQNAGLVTDEHGSLMPFYISNAADVEEDARSNELVWLLGKIANHIAAGDALDPKHYALPPGQRPLVGVTQEQLLERWNILIRELQNWRCSLPASFNPSARTTGAEMTGAVEEEEESCPLNFEKIWYEAPICAATMQSYHMACILLLTNQPQESTAVRSSVSARLDSYRQSEREALRHAREICGISLTNPPDSVRVHSVQALFVAGQVFTDSQDLQVVLGLLSSIERDLGWTTSHHASRITDLLARRSSDKDPEWIFS